MSPDEMTKEQLIELYEALRKAGKRKRADAIMWKIQDRLDRERKQKDPSWSYPGYTGRNSNR